MTSDTSASLQFLDLFSGSEDRGPLPPDASFIGSWDLSVGIDTLHEAQLVFDFANDLLQLRGAEQSRRPGRPGKDMVNAASDQCTRERCSCFAAHERVPSSGTVG